MDWAFIIVMLFAVIGWNLGIWKATRDYERSLRDPPWRRLDVSGKHVSKPDPQIVVDSASWTGR